MMLNKRRRASSVASKDDDVIDDSTPEQSPVLSIGTGRKRKRPDPSELCQQLYDSIRNIKKEDGTMLCDTFIRAPKRRQEPSYYEVVANPIDLLRVQQKLKTDTYDDVEELTADIELLVNNAKAFYKNDSIEYQDACILLETYINKKNLLLESIGFGFDDEPRIRRIGRQPRRSTANESETSETSTNKYDEHDNNIDQYEELFVTIMSATDPTQDNRPLHSEFQLLPSKKMYPEYYDVVEHPIDLRLIATKIQTNAYSNLLEMEKDFLQLIKNACVFNEPGSQIYKDAKTLKKIFTMKKFDIENGKVKSIKRRGISISATIAALKDEPESSSDDDGDNEKKGEGPMWNLFDHLYNAASASDHPNATGAPLGQSLWKLPHRRFRPEYYEIIKKPISMSQIQAKLKKGEYANISDFTADLYLMLDNAKKAFPASQRIHKDANKMLKIMNAKIVDDGLELENSDSEDEDSQSSESPPKKKGRPRLASNLSVPSTSSVNITNSTSIPCNISPKNRPQPINLALKKKLLGLQKYLTEYTLGNRRPMSLFIEKPSKKLYPDYYDIIQYPIDMTTIENYIRSDKYSTLDDVVGDYRLMFSNCRKYNEEGSQIFEDANALEKALNDKLKEFSGFVNKNTGPKSIKIARKFISPLDSKLWQFYDTIRDYHEPKGNRQLSIIFMKLPSKSDYPDYYDIIKNPIDMEKVSQKLKQQLYDSTDDLAADFLIMFENACRYNEPDSQIYKDALILQQLCIQTKQSLRINDERVPDVSLSVQEMLLSLFTALYNHQDEEGRCYSDSLAELPEYDEMAASNNRIRGISLDLIKRRLDKGLYKRLDIFQEDLFSCLERARKLSRTDSQVFEDSIELQSYFIKKRDELCKDIFSSPALSYTTLHLSAAVENLRQLKLLQEEQDQEENDTAATQGESMIIDQKVYSPGDFVHFDSGDNKMPGIAYIERLWTENNIKMMYGTLFLRPHETYHVTTRKFLEQEVFKSDQRQPIPLSKVQSKCYVMSIKDYIKLKPDGFHEKDVYVCESRYSMKARSFKKIKHWAFVRDNDPIKFVTREHHLELKRIMSVFKERVEKHKGELAELKLREALIEKEKPNVLCLIGGGEEGKAYYEQYNTICSGVVKTGDYVYVASQSGKQSIAQIHNIWESSDGTKSYFQGPWLLAPNELPTNFNKTFYRQELFLSTVQETNPIIAIVGRCAVLEYNEYTTRRPTEIPESDIYICENIYDEIKKNIKRFQHGSGLKKFNHSQLVTPDEIYHFKRPLKLLKINMNSYTDPSKSMIQKYEVNDSLGVLDDSLDDGTPSVSSDVNSCPSPIPSSAAAALLKKKSLTQPKSSKVTGYILYSSGVRRGIRKKNPEATFGDISRMVGNEWKNLTSSVRQSWEDKAGKVNEENAKIYLEEMANWAGPFPPEPNQIYECLWDKCDFQFEDVADCTEHCLADPTGHVYTYFQNKPEIEYQCMWKNCMRQRKKNVQPFPHMQRLVKHVKEVHMNKCNKIVQVEDRKKNFVARKVAPVVNNPIQQPQQQQQQPMNIQNISPRISNIQELPVNLAPEPMFVTVPPRPQRVLHSEAYIKYIESLQNNTNYIAPWDKTLRASQHTVPIHINKLPTHWLNDHVKNRSGDVVSALWHLRDFMLKDVTEIKRNYL